MSDNPDCSEEAPGTDEPGKDYSRREALRALARYSAFVGVTGVVILSAEDVVANPGNTSCELDCINAGGAPGQCKKQCDITNAINNAINN